MDILDKQYEGFLSTSVWIDLQAYFKECVELNRDLLEGVQRFHKDVVPETNDVLRGRNKQIRDTISYILTRAGASDGPN